MIYSLSMRKGHVLSLALFSGAIGCFAAFSVIGSTVAPDGRLIEPFFLIPLGWFFLIGACVSFVFDFGISLFLNRNTFRGTALLRSGSITDKNILVILGRNNFLKDEDLIESLVESLSQKNLTIVCYEHEGVSVAKQINLACDRLRSVLSTVHVLTDFEIKMLKMILMLQYPRTWKYFFLAKRDSPNLVKYQTKQLRLFLKQFHEDQHLVLLSRSASGRAASLVVHESCIKKIICLGYPFRQPGKPEEDERTRPLISMPKPYLIFQGTEDVYGGKDVLERYQFSSQVSLSFVEADHDFLVSEEEWVKAIVEIKKFIEV